MSGQLEVGLMEQNAQGVRVRGWGYRMLWLCIVLCHASIGGYYMGLAWFHKYLRDLPDTTTGPISLTDVILFSTTGTVREFLPLVWGLSLAFAAGHGIALLNIVCWSIVYRSMVFGRYAVSSPSRHPSAKAYARFGKVFRSLGQIYARVFGRNGFLGTQYKHATTVLLLREVVEVTVQMRQGYRLSYNVSSVWINRVYSLVAAANALSAPISHRYFRFQSAKASLATAGADLVFTIVNSIAVPLAIVYPYYRKYHGRWEDFDPVDFYVEDWFNGVWPVLDQVFVGSWDAFVCNMLPGFALLGYLGSIKNIASFSTSRVHGQVVPGPELPSPHKLQAKPPSSLTSKLCFLLILISCTIFVAHVHTTVVGSVAASRGCLHEVRPWFCGSYVCDVLEISCATQGIAGTEQELDELLSSTDTHNPIVVIFSHCPQLEIPEIIARFDRLEQLKIFNCTIAKWRPENALTQSTNPSLQALFVLESNMSELPRGIRHSSLPTSLFDIEFSGTNLTELPEDVVTLWQNVGVLVVEASPSLVSIPHDIGQMPMLSLICLIGNGIEVLPDEAFQGAVITCAYLDGNPITKLPPTFGDSKNWSMLSLQHTQVTSIPSAWLDLYRNYSKWGEPIIVWGGGTPMCQILLSNGELQNVSAVSGDPKDGSHSVSS